MALTAPNASSARYAQHHPEQTLLYQIVAEHLETFLEEARSEHERGLPKYVEREFQAYLACGIHAHGFLRARCRHCGKDLLVAFSCKKRGVCPSCNARRMCGTAAHLPRAQSEAFSWEPPAGSVSTLVLGFEYWNVRIVTAESSANIPDLHEWGVEHTPGSRASWWVESDIGTSIDEWVNDGAIDVMVPNTVGFERTFTLAD